MNAWSNLQLHPVTPTLIDAMATAITNAFFVLKFRVFVEVKAAEPAPVTVKSQPGNRGFSALHSSFIHACMHAALKAITIGRLQC